jgi:hypothetical protein
LNRDRVGDQLGEKAGVRQGAKRSQVEHLASIRNAGWRLNRSVLGHEVVAQALAVFRADLRRTQLARFLELQAARRIGCLLAV